MYRDDVLRVQMQIVTKRSDHYNPEKAKYFYFIDRTPQCARQEVRVGRPGALQPDYPLGPQRGGLISLFRLPTIPPLPVLPRLPPPRGSAAGTRIDAPLCGEPRALCVAVRGGNHSLPGEACHEKPDPSAGPCRRSGLQSGRHHRSRRLSPPDRTHRRPHDLYSCRHSRGSRRDRERAAPYRLRPYLPR